MVGTCEWFRAILARIPFRRTMIRRRMTFGRTLCLFMAIYVLLSLLSSLSRWNGGPFSAILMWAQEDDTEGSWTRLFRIYQRNIPNVDEWQEFVINNNTMRVKLDPRLPKTYLESLQGENWEESYKLSPDEDPFRLFNNPDLDMADPVLIRYLRQMVLVPPSNEDYNLTFSNVSDPSEWQSSSKIMLPTFFSKLAKDDEGSKGVFFEAGVMDGEAASRSLYLERFEGWKGLVAEMTWPNINRFFTKHRKCWFAPACLSPHRWPVRRNVRFAYDPIDGPYVEVTGTLKRKKKIEVYTELKYPQVHTIVDCFPLYSLLLAANMTKVDFLSIDVEGAEVDVLKTVPFEKLDVAVVTVEVLLVDDDGVRDLKNYMEASGFHLHPWQDQMSSLTQDARSFFQDSLVFVRS